MNILIICRRGTIQSKFLAETLEKRGHDTRYRAAIIGPNVVTKEDVEWASKILVFEDWMANLFMDLKKVVLLGNVPDIYFSEEQRELREFCRNIIPYLGRYGI